MSGGVVLVTGAAGFAGSHLLERLRGTADVVAWSRSDVSDRLRPLARWQRVDLLDRTAVARALRDTRPGRVFHLAGLPHVAQSWQRSADALRGNTWATHVLFDELRRAGLAARVLVTGSATVYAASDEPIDEGGALAPSSPYAISKLAQEERALRAVNEDGLEVVVARAFNHTGPGQTAEFAAPGFARQIVRIERGAQPPVLRVGNLDAVRDLSDVRDVVRAYALLMDLGASGQIYNVASGSGRSIRAVLEALVARSATPVTVELDPERLRPSDTPSLVGSPAKLRAATGWSPTIPFEQTVDDLLAYWRSE